MGRKSISIAIALLAVSFVWLHAQLNDSRSLPSLVPAGAIFYLEAKDFRRLMEQWNSSEERRRWLKSDNASVLGQSRLLQRLMQAQTQFATVAGLPVEMSLVNELAGAQSAFAFYDFSTVRFVYLTHLDGQRLDQSSLWKSRSSYQSREVAGIPFYVKTQTDGRNSYTVAFASHNGWLAVATDTNLMASTLALLAGQPATSVSLERWFTETVKSIPEPGDLRLVYNLAALRKSPQFRTYWIQRNNTELGGFSSGSADVFEQKTGFEERRALLRTAPLESKPDTSALSEVLGQIPVDASLYRAWANPDRESVKAALQQVILSESPGGPDLSRNAPEVSAEAPIAGSDADLEKRIDEPAFHRASENNLDEVTDAVMAMKPQALLHSQLTRLAQDRVFVMPESEVAVVCEKPNRAALDTVLGKTVSITKTGSLDPLRVAETSRALVLSRISVHTSKKASVLASETYAAEYEQAVEWPRYKRLFSLVDRSTDNAPNFFSRNLRSLGDSLYRLQLASIITQEEGAVTRDTVRYEFATK